MLKNLSLILLLMTAINCIAHKEILANKQNDLREEAYERARALFAKKENRSAIRTLEKIMNSNPVDALTLDAAAFAAEICLSDRNPEKASEILNSFEKRASGKNIDKSRLVRLRDAVMKLTKIEEPKLGDPKLAMAPVQAGPLQAQPSQAQPSQARPVPVLSSSRSFGRTIGILLPLSGSYEVYGKRAFTSIQLGFKAIAQQLSDGAVFLRNAQGTTMIVLDTKGDPQLARILVDKLVDEFRVGIIVGDILSDTAASIAQQSQARDVVNLSLSRREGLSRFGPLVFQLGVTATGQVNELLAINKNDDPKKRYAILYPENPFGKEMRDVFLRQAKAQGALVVRTQSYKPNETTFLEPIRQLVGPKRTIGNPIFDECSERANRIKDIAARKKAERDCVDAVAPIVNFDALFIPDFPKTLTYIVPALIAEGIMVSQNDDLVRSWRRTTGMINSMPVQLLGPSSWNNQLVGDRLKTQVEGALFVDSGDFSEQGEIVKNFSEAFTRASNSEPVLSDAMAFDAVRLAVQVLDENIMNLNSENMKGRLQTVSFEGMFGKIGFDENRELRGSLRLFSFQDGKIIGK